MKDALKTAATKALHDIIDRLTEDEIIEMAAAEMVEHATRDHTSAYDKTEHHNTIERIREELDTLGISWILFADLSRERTAKGLLGQTIATGSVDTTNASDVLRMAEAIVQDNEGIGVVQNVLRVARTLDAEPKGAEA